MSKRGAIFVALGLLAFEAGFHCRVAAETVSDYTVQVSASVQAVSPAISLVWPPDANATNYTVFRKLAGAASWATNAVLTGDSLSYSDTNVSTETLYEYQIHKSTPAYDGYGYVYAGINVPLVEFRGTVVLLVDNTQTASLSRELARLQQDLVGDGWKVVRHDVPRMATEPSNLNSNGWTARSNELVAVRALVTNDFNADPANVKAVFIIGRVPVPYSGNLWPDGHTDHLGAWPADVFYGDVNGIWGDSLVNATAATDPRNRNSPGDGKLDSSLIASDLELQVGRVDFANMPAFTQGETELLRQYLNKDHRFRHKNFTPERRGLVNDNLGLSAGEPIAASGWRNFAPFFGASNILTTANWFGTLAVNSYLWGYTCGWGTYTNEMGLGNTADFVTQDPHVVFTMMFGSYFGDWDTTNNFLRAPLCTPGYTLTCSWAAHPHWYVQHMALGETIGFSARITQNNTSSIYPGTGYKRQAHIALMGDPTLRMHMIAPVSNLATVANSSGAVELRWDPSPDSVAGYVVYRSPTADGPFTRLNPAHLITGTNYTDNSASGSNTYMVRAVKLEVTASGSYWNASQGIFCTFVPLPLLTITANSTNKVYGSPLPAFTASYDGFVDGDTTNSLTSQAVLCTTAVSENAVGSYPITAAGASSSKYTIVYVPGTLRITPASTSGLLTSSTNPALPGHPVTFALTVSAVAPGVGTPTGSVQFNLDGTNAATTTLSGGTTVCTASTLAQGMHTVVVEYAGDANFFGTTNLLSPSQLINTPPVACPDMLARAPENGLNLSIATLLSNDFDPDGDLLSLLAVNATSTNGGTIVTNDNWIIYTPVPGSTNVDAFTYTIGDIYGASAVGLVTVNIRVDNNPTPNLAINDLGNGSIQVIGDGIPGRTYRLQFTTDLDNPDWQVRNSATADENGLFNFLDIPGSHQRFYRTVSP